MFEPGRDAVTRAFTPGAVRRLAEELVAAVGDALALPAAHVRLRPVEELADEPGLLPRHARFMPPGRGTRWRQRGARGRFLDGLRPYARFSVAARADADELLVEVVAHVPRVTAVTVVASDPKAAGLLPRTAPSRRFTFARRVLRSERFSTGATHAEIFEQVAELRLACELAERRAQDACDDALQDAAEATMRRLAVALDREVQRDDLEATARLINEREVEGG